MIKEFKDGWWYRWNGEAGDLYIDRDNTYQENNVKFIRDKKWHQCKESYHNEASFYDSKNSSLLITWGTDTDKVSLPMFDEMSPEEYKNMTVTPIKEFQMNKGHTPKEETSKTKEGNMDKKSFKKYMLALKEAITASNEFNKGIKPFMEGGFCTLGFALFDTYLELLAENFKNPKSAEEMLSYYIWDLAWGTEEESNIVTIGVTEYKLDSIDKLYDFLILEG